MFALLWIQDLKLYTIEYLKQCCPQASAAGEIADVTAGYFPNNY